MLNIQKLKVMKKIKEEFKALNEKPITGCGISFGLVDEDNIFRWKTTINGPRDTPYYGGWFTLEIHFPDNYPEAPPEFLFTTPIYHINVNPFKSKGNEETTENLGHISLNILKFWKPEYTIEKVLIYLYSLFYEPNPNCGYGFERVYEFKENRNLYEQKIKYFTKKYANPLICKQNYNSDWDFNVDINCLK